MKPDRVGFMHLVNYEISIKIGGSGTKKNSYVDKYIQLYPFLNIIYNKRLKPKKLKWPHDSISGHKNVSYYYYFF